jgi:glucokinase
MIGALDIGGTKIALGLVSPDGRILGRGAVPTDPLAGFDAAMRRTVDLYQRLCAEAGARPEGLGIGCTGPIDPVSGVFGRVDTLPGWEGSNLKAALCLATGLDSRIENDADAHALGELVWGAGRDALRLIMITVGTGIGGGIILNGQVYRGLGGSHPELGHHTLEASGPLCVCGGRGCWEILAAGPHWESWFQHTYPECADWDGQRICAAADSGDPRARAAVEREGFYLGVGLANLINLYAPDAIVLGGGVMERFDLFIGRIQSEIQVRCSYIPYGQVRLERARLGVDAGLLGAAEVWKRRDCA